MAEHKTPKKKYKKKPNGKNDVGRPSKKTEEVIKKLEEIFKVDGTIEEACSQAGISTPTLYEWMENDGEFSRRMEAARNYLFIVARKTLAMGVLGGDQKSAIEILKRRDKRYNDKQDITSQGEKVSFTVMNYKDE